MRLFRRKSRAVKKWHDKALTINFNKTHLTIVESTQEKKVPAWVYKEFIQNNK